MKKGLFLCLFLMSFASCSPCNDRKGILTHYSLKKLWVQNNHRQAAFNYNKHTNQDVQSNQSGYLGTPLLVWIKYDSFKNKQVLKKPRR